MKILGYKCVTIGGFRGFELQLECALLKRTLVWKIASCDALLGIGFILGIFTRNFYLSI